MLWHGIRPDTLAQDKGRLDYFRHEGGNHRWKESGRIRQSHLKGNTAGEEVTRPETRQELFQNKTGSAARVNTGDR